MPCRNHLTHYHSDSMQNILYIVGLAAVAANLPFFSEKIFFFAEPKKGTKAFVFRLLELLVLYVGIGVLAFWLEGQLSPVHQQKWPFYATTFALFIVFAWPGFVWRYFWRRPGV
jgi:hypothetical protein